METKYNKYIHNIHQKHCFSMTDLPFFLFEPSKRDTLDLLNFVETLIDNEPLNYFKWVL